MAALKSILLLALLCQASLALLQSDAPLSSSSDVGSSDENSTIQKNVDEVTLLLSAVDKHGRLVPGLRQEQFRVLDDDHPVEHFSYFQSGTDLPLRMAVLIDVSGSVTPQLSLEAGLTKAFVNRVLRPQDWINVTAFRKKTWPLDWNVDQKALRKVNKGNLDGTAIYDAVRAACIDLAKPTPTLSRRMIVLLTDGDDNGSRTTLEETIHEALRSEVTIYVLNTTSVPEVYMGYTYKPSNKNPLNLRRLAGETGGEIWKASDARVIDAFKKVELAIRNQYVLAYKPNPDRMDGRFHRLTVSSTERNVKVRGRSGYFALRTDGEQ